MPLQTHNGVALHVQELGSGAPLVMLHGLLVGSLATWFLTCAPSLARSHRVLVYDLRGHGLSERAPRGYDVATMRADLGSIVDGFTREPVTLVGHSYGGVVALSYALLHPDRVKRLVLVEAPLPPSRVGELEGFLARSPDEMAQVLPDTLKQALERKRRHAAKLLRTLRFLSSESTLFADLRAERDLDDATLARVACPLLCVYGTHSSCRAVGARLARVVPGARLVELDAGHFLPVEKPRELGDVLEEFLRG